MDQSQFHSKAERDAANKPQRKLTRDDVNRIRRESNPQPKHKPKSGGQVKPKKWTRAEKKALKNVLENPGVNNGGSSKINSAPTE